MIASAAPPPAIPTCPGLPIVGNLFEFRRDLPHLLLRASREYGDIVRLPVGRHQVIFINSPEYIHAALVERTDAVEKKSGGDSARALVMGDGLLNSDGLFHQHQRKLCAPAFQPRGISAYVSAMTYYAQRVLEEWADGSVIDLSEQMHRMAMGIAGKALFSADLLDEADEIKRALFTIRRYIGGQSRGILHSPLSWNTRQNNEFKQAKERLDATIFRLISERQQAGAEQHDLLSMLLVAQDEEGSHMSLKLVRDEAVNLFWAGHETTATALTWTWYLLAQHPDVNARLRTELKSVLGGRPPGVGDIPALAYTQKVFKEALRLYPPIFAFGRHTQQPIDLGGHILPANCPLLISPYALHRRPDAFPDPERFNPDRFTPDRFTPEGERLLRLSYLPFGSGPRVCIGAHFAMMEGAMVLATLAQRVRFELLPGQNIVPEQALTRQTEEPVRVRVWRE